MPKDLITYQYQDTNICIRRYWNRTELLFNEKVADCRKGIVEFAYCLKGELGESIVAASMMPNLSLGGDMTLYIDGMPVAKAFKL
ncbi:MAG: hypothetical protein HFG44_01480 [Oscillospiraceae bacterium]|nr:hypothetical protein [Oscillospiraceae bacterium]